MKTRKTDNTFKQKVINRDVIKGVWNGIPDPTVAEIMAGSGFDFICVDAEHGPFVLNSVLGQLRALSAYSLGVLVRLPDDQTSRIKQFLDIGCENLLIPMVESSSQASQIVAATRYPPAGKRGVGTALARASRWNRYSDYFSRSDDEICVVVQVESARGLENLEDICLVPGVDAVFIGPADLAASTGYLGQPEHPDNIQQVIHAIRSIVSNGKTAGVLATNPELMKTYKEEGATFLGIGLDTIILSKGCRHLIEAFGDI